MAACRECHTELSAADRFCSSCGRGVDEGAALGTNDGVELFGTTGPPLADTTNVKTATGRSRGGLFAVVGLAAVGLLLFTLLGSPNPDPDDPQNALLRSEDEPEDVDEDGDDETAATTEEERTTTTRRSTTFVLEVQADVSYIGDGQPLLGEESGLYLFIGGDSSKLRRIDLDTGEVVEYPERIFPSYATGEYLIGSNPQNGNAKVMLIDDPTVDTGITLNSGYYYPGTDSLKEGPEPGQLWVIGDDFPNPSWKLVQLSSGDVLREIGFATQTFYGPTMVGPMVAGSPSGGVFDLQDDTYVRVGDGSPLSVSDQYVLAEDCASPVDCELYWLERQSWTIVDRPVPNERPQWVRLSADGRVLMFYGPSGSEIFDVERGESVTGLGADLEGIAVSPTGRYVFAPTGSLRVHDLDTGEVFTLDGLSMGGWGAGLFVEKP